jgi:DNA-binding transcriptional ArsR family regulator
VDQKETLRLARTFAALGDPTRLKIALTLATGEMRVQGLADLLGISPSAVSHALRRLKDLALVRHRADGQNRWYSLDDGHVAAILQTGLEHVRE